MADPDPTLYRQRALAINAVSSILNAADHWAEPETCDDIVTAVLDAHTSAHAASGQQPGTPQLTLRDRLRRAVCEAEGFTWDSDMLEPDEYGDHADAALAALAAHEAATRPDPTTADDPTPLRWGHGDVIHGDDDTVTICFSGPAPDRAPYWLELDPERAAALRDDLAAPDAEEPQDHPAADLYVRLRKAGEDDATAQALIYAHARMAVREHTALNDDIEPSPQVRPCSCGTTTPHTFCPDVRQPTEAHPADTEQLVHVGWWCWRGDNHGHLATQACRSDNVPIHVPTEWADDMTAVIQRIEDGDEPVQDETPEEPTP
ncbi:hypothetical protein ACFWV1_25815 [Streptomyces sp. NPDC058700]|uniref:hypothetical protein n=1 Tax=Streptomyces sp. NPDC058700 TaxID=3346607 RepID=UPI00364D39CD